MTIQVKHSYTSPILDDAEPGIVGPEDWNAAHNITMATDRLLGRTTAGTGTVEEITTGAGLTLATGILANTDRGSTAVTTHEGLSDPHPQYLTPAEGNAAYDASGAASSAVAAHVGALDPHTQYALESALGTAAALNIDTDGTLAANSDTVLATQKAIKTYADQLIAAADVMVFKGVIDCSASPNYPAADAGWTYRVSVAGKIGGGSGVVVEQGDLLLCLVDGTASGNQATVGTSWSVAQANIDGAVIGPASATSSRVAVFSGTSGKLIADGGQTVASLLDRTNHTGTQSADTLTDGTTNKAFLATERTKLSGIATGATANSSDATLLARANHTGTQLAATISDFTAATQAVAVIRVNHGSTAGTARPSGAVAVEWIGSVAPTNGSSADTWLNNT